jgi:hypothetical protein
MNMRITPTVVVEVGALICVTGALLLSRLELSPHEILLVRAVTAIVIGALFIQIGYAQSLCARLPDDPKKGRAPDDRAE